MQTNGMIFLNHILEEYSKNKMAKLVSETTNHHKRKGLSETKEQRKKLKYLSR